MRFDYGKPTPEPSKTPPVRSEPEPEALPAWLFYSMCGIMAIAMVGIILHKPIAGWAKEQYSQLRGQVGPSNRRVSEEDPIQRGARAWALACSALPWERFGADHRTLAGGFEGPEGMNHAQEILSSTWGIESRQDLLNAINYLLNEGGDRARFTQMGEQTEGVTPEQFDHLVKYSGQADERRAWLTARKHHQDLGEASLIGWDLTRYIAMCRLGYAVGYLSEQEAWTLIMPAARQLQSAFDSWKELGRNYLVGREFVLPDDEEAARQSEEALLRLTTDPASPWKSLPWSFDLGAGGARATSEKR